MRVEEKVKAIELRKQGKSVKGISDTLGVAKSSVSRWVRDVELTEEQLLNLHNDRDTIRIASSYKAGKTNIEKFSLLRKEYQKNGAAMFKQYGHEFMNGCMLYWAEGSKSRFMVRLTNSDHHMILYFASFLKKFFDLKDNEIKYSFTFYLDGETKVEDVENYWSKCLNVNKEKFNKVSINRVPRKANTARRERTKHGVCHITVCNVKIVQALYGAIQDYLGFENEEWLNNR